MRTQQTIPFIFGVVGHRDIRLEDVTQLKDALLFIFSQHQKEYPYTDIILLSALAEGADQLAAEVALELGITLKTILPYKKIAYLQSFKDRSAAEYFELLVKQYEADCLTLPCDNISKVENCYQRLGEYIIDQCNVLVALYDGKDTRKRGGTSAIVNHAREGFNENRFDQLDGNALYIVNTPRQSNPYIDRPFEIKQEYLGTFEEQSFKEMLSRIEQLNTDVKGNIESNDILSSFIAYFDKKAMKHQKRFHFGMVLILVLTWVAVFCLELMHNLHIDPFIIGYGAGLLAAFGTYRFFMKNGDTQSKFVHSRGFAEALRVQDEWAKSGVDSCAAKYYLTNSHNKFSWMRIVLKNIYYLSKKDKYKPGNAKKWINGQVNYFTKNIPKKKNKLNTLENIERLLYRSGFAALLTMFALYALEALHIIGHHTLPFSWHLLVLISGALLMSAAFIGEEFAKIQGYEEDIYNYKIMLSIFKKAELMIEGTSGNSPKYRQIIHDLGKKALEENAKWVVLHESRQAKPGID